MTQPRASRRHRRSSQPHSTIITVESLESRRLLSAAPAYTIVDLGEFPKSVDDGSKGAHPQAVTDDGTVVGYTQRVLGSTYAGFIWTKSTGMQKLTAANASNPDDPSAVTTANDIASDGTIVGESDGVPVIWSSASAAPTQLPLPGGDTGGGVNAADGTTYGGNVFTPGVGISGAEWNGDSTSTFVAPANNVNGLATVDGSIIQVGATTSSGTQLAEVQGQSIGALSGFTTSTATDINAAGQVVGYSSTTGNSPISEAFLYTQAGGMVGLGSIGAGYNSQANAINDGGIVVGDIPEGQADHAFVWTQSGGVKDLNGLISKKSHWILEDATAISDNGLIVGTGVNASKQLAAFLLIPTPGPLTPAVAKTSLPNALVSGTSTHGTVTVSLSNSSGAVQKGPATINLYASTDGSIDSSSALIQSFPENVNVHPGRAQSLTLRIKSLPALSNATYTLLAQATDGAGSFNATQGPSLVIAAPFVSFSAALLHANSKTGATVAITNNGNIDDTGAVTFVQGLSTDAAGQNTVGSTLSGTLLAKADLKHGKTTNAHVKGWQSLLTELAAGQYYLTVTITDGNGNHATAVSATPATVG